MVRNYQRRSASKPAAVRAICISDTHGQHGQLEVPPGDILIHAGDFMHSGRRLQEIVDFDQWLGTLTYLHRWLRSECLENISIVNRLAQQSEKQIANRLRSI